jgi:WD40 repeat protein
MRPSCVLALSGVLLVMADGRAVGQSYQAYVINSTSGPIPPTTTLRTFNLSTGDVTATATVTGHEFLSAATISPTLGSVFSIDGYNDGSSDRTFRINPATGAGTVVGNTGFNWNFRLLEFHPTTGVLYGATDGTGPNGQLYTINPTTGAATFQTSITGTNGQVTALAIRSDGVGFVTDLGASTTLRQINLATGATTVVGTTGSQLFTDLAFAPDGKLYGLTNGSGGTVWELNPSTGSATVLYGLGGGGQAVGLAVLVAPVPEPASVGLVCAAALGVVVVRRRRAGARAAPGRTEPGAAPDRAGA